MSSSQNRIVQNFIKNQQNFQRIINKGKSRKLHRVDCAVLRPDSIHQESEFKLDHSQFENSILRGSNNNVILSSSNNQDRVDEQYPPTQFEASSELRNDGSHFAFAGNEGLRGQEGLDATSYGGQINVDRQILKRGQPRAAITSAQPWNHGQGSMNRRNFWRRPSHMNEH